MTQRPCRFCKAELTESFADLGMSPLSNAFISEKRRHSMEAFYPLHAYVCGKCFLVQLEEFESPKNIFSDYVYFSSYSESWLNHAEQYASQMIERFGLNPKSKVIEVASNDGYLLQYFKKASIPVLGIEPAENVAKVAIQKGIPSEVLFFGAETASQLANEGQKPDLIAANNVMAHVPDLNDFVQGFKNLLKSEGVITVEFPHLLQLMNQNQFDTIYHEHFSYFSFLTVEKVFKAHGLTIFDVDQLSTHGGSLRIYACHQADSKKEMSKNVIKLRNEESAAGLDRIETYRKFSDQVRDIKRQLLGFLIRAKQEGKTVVGYGAPAKGNTLLNYCGVRTDFIDYTVDRNPHKQNQYLPGVHIPVKDPEMIRKTKPDYLLILPWNLRKEISGQMAFIRDWNGKFVVPIPGIEIF